MLYVEDMIDKGTTLSDYTDDQVRECLLKAEYSPMLFESIFSRVKDEFSDRELFDLMESAPLDSRSYIYLQNELSIRLSR